MAIAHFNTDDSTMDHVIQHILLELQAFLRAGKVTIECELTEKDFYNVVERVMREYKDEVLVVRDDGDVDKALKELQTFTLEFPYLTGSKVVLKKGGPGSANVSLPASFDFKGPMLEG